MERFKLTLYNHRYIITSICIVIFLILSYIFYFKNKLNKEEVIINDEIEEKEEIIDNSFIYIDIKGAINKPGVYKIDSNSRVIDAINKADGLNEEADTSL